MLHASQWACLPLSSATCHPNWLPHLCDRVAPARLPGGSVHTALAAPDELGTQLGHAPSPAKGQAEYAPPHSILQVQTKEL